MTIGFCGDLKFGRTVHSLILALSRYTGIRFVLISPKELAVPDYIKEEVLDKKKIPYTEVQSLDEAMPELDILYMTRIQRERFASEEEYLRLKDSYILTPKQLELAKPDMYILHPLPRVNEISVAVDDDPRAAYFTRCSVVKSSVWRSSSSCLTASRHRLTSSCLLPSAISHRSYTTTCTAAIRAASPPIEQELPQAFRPVEKNQAPSAASTAKLWWTNPQSNRAFPSPSFPHRGRGGFLSHFVRETFQ